MAEGPEEEESGCVVEQQQQDEKKFQMKCVQQLQFFSTVYTITLELETQ